MIKRDFSSESPANAMFRIWRAWRIRSRGRLYSLLGMFAVGSSTRISFGRGPKFMNSRGISLSAGNSFGDFARLECHRVKADAPTGQIEIGEMTTFGDFLHVGAINRVIIGKNVLGGSKILILDHNHGSPRQDMQSRNPEAPRDRALTSRGGVIIEDHVWIGDGAIVLHGVTLGEGCIIPANAVVQCDVPPYTVYRPLHRRHVEPILTEE